MARSWRQFTTKMERDAKAAGVQHADTLDVLNGHFRRVGLELAKRRQELGLTPEQVEQASGVDQGEISRIERGVADPRESTLVKIGQAMQMGFLSFLAPESRTRVRVRRGITGKSARGPTSSRKLPPPRRPSKRL